MHATVLQDNIESCSDTTWLNLSQCCDTWASTFNYYILLLSTLNAHFAITLDPLFNNCAKHLQARYVKVDGVRLSGMIFQAENHDDFILQVQCKLME